MTHTYRVAIDGMHCHACERLVTMNLSAIPGVTGLAADAQDLRDRQRRLAGRLGDLVVLFLDDLARRLVAVEAHQDLRRNLAVRAAAAIGVDHVENLAAQTLNPREDVRPDRADRPDAAALAAVLSPKSAWNAGQVLEFLAATRVPLRLSTLDAAGYPHITSLWSLYADGHFLCCTQRSALACWSGPPPTSSP